MVDVTLAGREATAPVRVRIRAGRGRRACRRGAHQHEGDERRRHGAQGVERHERCGNEGAATQMCVTAFGRFIHIDESGGFFIIQIIRFLEI